MSQRKPGSEHRHKHSSERSNETPPARSTVGKAGAPPYRAPSPDAPKARPRGRLENYVERVGVKTRPLRDLYAFFLRSSWLKLFLVAAFLFLLFNALFAALYVAVPGSIANAEAGSFSDAFFFSVETFGAIGYGYMYSRSAYGHTVVTLEAFCSLFVIALFTGLAYSKFARPHARVLFSEPICIEQRNGVPTLTFRIANERGNDIVEAAIQVSALRTFYTQEGSRLRRFMKLELERASSPVFILSWQVFHPIDEQSPLYGLTTRQLIDEDVRIFVAVTGLDGTFAQTIHARHIYWPEVIRVGHRFSDVIEDLGNGRVRMDYRKFHDTQAQDVPSTWGE